MFCKNCGNQLADGTAFCSNCGTPVNTTPTAEIAPDTATQPDMPKKAKKTNKRVIGGVVGAICAVVLVAVIVVGASWRNIAHAAMGEVDYYLWREGATIIDVLSTDALKDIMTAQNFSSQTEAKIDIPDEEMGISVDLDMSYEKSSKQMVAVAEPVLIFDGESAPIGSYKIDYKNKVLGVSAPDITDAQVVIDFMNFVMSGSAGAVSGNSNRFNFSDIDVKETVKILGTIIKDAEDDVLKDNITKGKQELDGKKYSTVELKIDGTTAIEFATSVVNGIMDNPEAKELFTSYIQMGIDAYAPFSYDIQDLDADDVIDLIRDSLDEAAEYATEDEIIYTVFYGSKDSIVNRRLEIPDEDFSIDIKTIIGKNKTSLDVSCDYFTAELEKTEENSSVTYRFDMSGENLSDIQIEAEELRVEKCSGVNVVLGDIEVYCAGLSINLNASLNGNSYDISSDASEDGYDLYDVSSSTTLNTNPDMSDFVQPDIKNGVDIEEFVERFEEDFEEFIYNSLY